MIYFLDEYDDGLEDFEKMYDNISKYGLKKDKKIDKSSEYIDFDDEIDFKDPQKLDPILENIVNDLKDSKSTFLNNEDDTKLFSDVVKEIENFHKKSKEIGYDEDKMKENIEKFKKSLDDYSEYAKTNTTISQDLKNVVLHIGKAFKSLFTGNFKKFKENMKKSKEILGNNRLQKITKKCMLLM